MVEAIGQGEQCTRQRLGHGPPSTIGQVLLANCECYCFWLTRRAGVLHARFALQFGKLTDQRGGKVGLRQTRSLEGMPAIVTRNVGTVCNRRDERLQARRASGQRAEALVIGDAIELGGHRLDAAGPIFRERKDRIVEATSEHALVASTHHLIGVRV